MSKSSLLIAVFDLPSWYTGTSVVRHTMPSSVRVRVVEARDLPEMDRTVRGESCTDAYVDIKFRNYEQVRCHVSRVLRIVASLWVVTAAVGFYSCFPSPAECVVPE